MDISIKINYNMLIFKYLTFSFFSVGFLLTPILAQEKKTISLTFEQSLQLMKQDNKSLKIADKQIELAKNEHQKMNSFWYPKITATGAYTHFSNNIEVRESLSKVTDPAKELLQLIDPNNQMINGLLNKIGQDYFSLTLAPQNLTTVDAVITYPLFTGGKRIFASKIGKQLVNVASVTRDKVDASQQVQLVQTYYGVRLNQRIVEVRQATLNSMEQHYNDALKLEQNGMLTKAERLYFEVNRDEAKRELESAKKELNVAQNAFLTLVKLDEGNQLEPVSSMFINTELPSLSYFKGLVSDNNYDMKALNLQKDIQKNQIKIANAAYIPNIELIGKQTLYSHGVDKYLIPRSMIGIGFSWNIFDGLDREKKVQQAKIERSITELQKSKAVDDLNLALDQLYSQAQIALDNVNTLKTTIEMSNELVNTRQKAFVEGMTTSTEVIDAELMLSKVRLASLLAYYQFDLSLINLLSLCGIPEQFYNYKNTGTNENHIFN